MVTGSKQDQLLGIHISDYSSTHTLCLVPDTAGVYWCVSDDAGQIVSLGYRVLDLSNSSEISVFASQLNGNHGFAKVVMGWYSDAYVLIPNALYDFHSAPDVLEMSTGIRSDSPLVFSNVRLGATMVADVSRDAIRSWEAAFPGCRTYPVAACNVELVLGNNRFDRPPQIYIDLTNGRGHMIAYANKTLRLVNSFPISTKDELLYYTANVCKQLQIDPGVCEVYLSGQVVEGAKDLLYTYFKEVQLFQGFHDHLDAVVATHEFAAVLNIAACA